MRADTPVEMPTLTAAQGCMQVATALCNTLDSCAPVALKVLYGDKSICVTRAALSCPARSMASHSKASRDAKWA